MVLIGAIFFTVTQAIIGLDTFHEAIPYRDIFIMLFYGSSQLCIIMGVLSLKSSEKEELNISV